MDPDATLRNIRSDLMLLARDHIPHDDRQNLKDAVAENLERLAQWLRKGGFSPDPFPIFEH